MLLFMQVFHKPMPIAPCYTRSGTYSNCKYRLQTVLLALLHIQYLNITSKWGMFFVFSFAGPLTFMHLETLLHGWWTPSQRRASFEKQMKGIGTGHFSTPLPWNSGDPVSIQLGLRGAGWTLWENGLTLQITAVVSSHCRSVPSRLNILSQQR